MMAERALNGEGGLAKMRGLIFGYSITRSIAVAAELGIANQLAEGSQTPRELARRCGVMERPLYRILRALAGEGVFAENDDGRFALTPMAELLRSDHPRSLRDWAIFMADLPHRASMEMLHSLKTGGSAFRKAFGLPLFDYLSANPGYGNLAFRAMSSISAARTAGLLAAYDFSQVTRLVDVGGAHGSMCAAITKRYASIAARASIYPVRSRARSRPFATAALRINAISSEATSSRMFQPMATYTSFRPSCMIGAMDNACRSFLTVGAAFHVRANF
jgi:hypothetical protein